MESSYTRWKSTHGGEYTQWRVHTVERTHGGENTRWREHTVESTHGEEYTRWRVHTVECTHRGDILTEGTYKRRGPTYGR